MEWDRYIGELLGSHQGCQVAFRTLWRNMELLLDSVAGKGLLLRWMGTHVVFKSCGALVTHSLFLAARVWVSIPLDGTGDKSWLVSTNNDNPFLITSNWFRLFRGPHARQVKEISWAGYFWKRFLQSFKESCQVKWDPVQRFLIWLCLSTMVIICAWQSRKPGRTWDLDDALELLNQPAV